MNENEEKYASFIQERISKSGQGSVPIQHLTGHLSQLSANVRNSVGGNKLGLVSFLRKFPEVFNVDDRGHVSMKTKPFESINKKLSLSDLTSINDENNQIDEIIDGNGVIVNVSPTYGFIAIKHPVKTTVHFTPRCIGWKNSNGTFNRDTDKTLMSDFSNEIVSGKKVCFNAIRGSDTFSAKFRATEVWFPVDPQNEVLVPEGFKKSRKDVKTGMLDAMFQNGEGKIQKLFPNFGFIIINDDPHNTVFFHKIKLRNFENVVDLCKILKVGDIVEYEANRTTKKNITVRWEATKVLLKKSQTIKAVAPSSKGDKKERKTLFDTPGKVYPRNKGTVIKFGKQLSDLADADSCLFYDDREKVEEIAWTFEDGADVKFDGIEIKSPPFWKAILAWRGTKPNVVLSAKYGDFTDVEISDGEETSSRMIKASSELSLSNRTSMRKDSKDYRQKHVSTTQINETNDCKVESKSTDKKWTNNQGNNVRNMVKSSSTIPHNKPLILKQYDCEPTYKSWADSPYPGEECDDASKASSKESYGRKSNYSNSSAKKERAPREKDTYYNAKQSTNASYPKKQQRSLSRSGSEESDSSLPHYNSYKDRDRKEHSYQNSYSHPVPDNSYSRTSSKSSSLGKSEKNSHNSTRRRRSSSYSDQDESDHCSRTSSKCSFGKENYKHNKRRLVHKKHDTSDYSVDSDCSSRNSPRKNFKAKHRDKPLENKSNYYPNSKSYRRMKIDETLCKEKHKGKIQEEHANASWEGSQSYLKQDSDHSSKRFSRQSPKENYLYKNYQEKAHKTSIDPDNESDQSSISSSKKSFKEQHKEKFHELAYKNHLFADKDIDTMPKESSPHKRERKVLDNRRVEKKERKASDHFVNGVKNRSMQNVRSTSNSKSRKSNFYRYKQPFKRDDFQDIFDADEESNDGSTQKSDNENEFLSAEVSDTNLGSDQNKDTNPENVCGNSTNREIVKHIVNSPQINDNASTDEISLKTSKASVEVYSDIKGTVSEIYAKYGNIKSDIAEDEISFFWTDFCKDGAYVYRDNSDIQGKVEVGDELKFNCIVVVDDAGRKRCKITLIYSGKKPMTVKEISPQEFISQNNIKVSLDPQLFNTVNTPIKQVETPTKIELPQRFLMAIDSENESDVKLEPSSNTAKVAELTNDDVITSNLESTRKFFVSMENDLDTKVSQSSCEDEDNFVKEAQSIESEDIVAKSIVVIEKTELLNVSHMGFDSKKLPIDMPHLIAGVTKILENNECLRSPCQKVDLDKTSSDIIKFVLQSLTVITSPSAQETVECSSQTQQECLPSPQMTTSHTQTIVTGEIFSQNILHI